MSVWQGDGEGIHRGNEEAEGKNIGNNVRGTGAKYGLSGEVRMHAK